MRYTRANPSPEYEKYIDFYKTMHNEGFDRVINGQTHRVSKEEAYSGIQLPNHVGAIKQLLERHNCKTVLDYGAGKGQAYNIPNLQDQNGNNLGSIQEFWQVDAITCYDPGVPDFSNLPDKSKKYDAVISTDMLEHCHIEDIPWILEEIFEYAKHMVFVNVACYPASARLPNGENAHCTIKSQDWWQGFFFNLGRNYPDVQFYCCFD